jgi:feruloyl esterase
VGAEQVSGFVRLYMAPGVEHCDSSPGPDTFDMFGELACGVEEGTAPDRVTASELDGGPGRPHTPAVPAPRGSRVRRHGGPELGGELHLRTAFVTITRTAGASRFGRS